MRTQLRRLGWGLMVASTAVGLVACGSKDQKDQKQDGPPVAEIDGTINTGTFDTTATLDCADGKSLNVGGSKNTLTVTGKCASVIVGGDDNKITFDTVTKEIVVAGLNNNVTYRQGEPSTQDLGTGNTIAKG